MKPKALRAIFLPVTVILPVLALVHVAQTRHAFLVISLYLKGKAGNCTLAESFQGEALSRLQAANVDRLRSHCRLVRKDDPYSLWSTPAGEYWAPTGSRDALIYDLGEQQRNIYGTGIRPGDIVLDAGANVGVFTRKALWAGAGKVIAIEPAPENLECLRRNFEREIADGRVVVYPKGVWDKDEILQMQTDPANSARDTFVDHFEGARTVNVPLTTIDELVQELHLPRVDFIKMDIEGAERKAISGAKNTIARYRPRMALSVYHLPGDEVILPKLVINIYPGYSASKTCLCLAESIRPEVAFF